MLSTATFLTIAQWVGITTLFCAFLAVLGFRFQWAARFQLVGVTGFFVVF